MLQGVPLGGGLIGNSKAPQQPQVPFLGGPNAAPVAPVVQQMSNPYAGILEQYVAATKARLGGQSAADRAGMLGNIGRAVASYGGKLDLSKLGISDQARRVLGELDPKVWSLAEQNTAEGTSVKARMDEANAIAQRRIPSSLAARGMLRSGQTGADLNQQAMDAKRGQFDVLNELLGNVEGSVSQYAQAEAARQQAIADAELQAQLAAAQAWGGSIDYGQPEPAPAYYPPDTSDVISRYLASRGPQPVQTYGRPAPKAGAMTPAKIAGLRGQAMANFYKRLGY